MKENEMVNQEEILQEMNKAENQGGDLTTTDYIVYVTLGVIFPLALLIWGWF